MSQNYHLIEIDWHHPFHEKLKAIREEVFIEEQRVPPYIEWDEADDSAIHLLLLDNMQEAIGCARLLPDKQRVGRMAVRKSWRGKGLGRLLLNHAIALCQAKGWHAIYLSSQTHAIPFYQAAGFKIMSDAYIDANIWHVDMKLEI